MKLTVTAQIKLLPDESQIELLKQTKTSYLEACNYISETAFNNNVFKNSKLHDDCYYDLRAKFRLPSQMACSVTKYVVSKYKSIKANKHKLTLVNFKKPMYELVYNRDYSFVKDVLSLNTLAGRIKVPYITTGKDQYFDGTWSFGTAIIKHKHGKWIMSIPVTKEVAEMNSFSNTVGIDLGVNFLATVYDGNKTTFYNGRGIKQKRANYSKTRKELQQKQTSSARHRLKTIGSRENRWMNDVNHCITKALCTKYDNTLFVLEDLTGIRNATEKVKLKNRYITVSWAFYDFRQKLTYKSILYGSSTITVDPKYTSQKCPICAHTEKGNRNKRTHTFKCKHCGYQTNDDRIGAMNLYNMGTEYQSIVTI